MILFRNNTVEDKGLHKSGDAVAKGVWASVMGSENVRRLLYAVTADLPHELRVGSKAQ